MMLRLHSWTGFSGVCFAKKHQWWNPSPRGGKAFTEGMQVRLCPEQLRPGHGWQHSSSHIKPACLWTDQCMQVFGALRHRQPDCPCPATWVSLHTAPGQDTTSASWASWSLPHQYHSRADLQLPCLVMESKMGLPVCPGVGSAHAQKEHDARGWGCPGALHCPTPDWDGGMGQAQPCHSSGTHVVPVPGELLAWVAL